MGNVVELQGKLKPLKVFSAGTMGQHPIRDREWLIPGILITHGVTLLGGDGGMGKSILCLQAQIAAWLGREWCGIPMPAGIRSFGLYCEDEWQEVHRRVDAILRYYNATYEDLGDNVRFACRVGEDNELMSFGFKNDKGRQTTLFTQLTSEIEKWQTQLIILDTVADTFGGNENVRPQVRGFVNSIRQLSWINHGGVILTAHPSRVGLVDGSGLSGSTAWNGSVRARVYLTRPPTPDADVDGDQEPTNERILKTMKSNYSEAGGKVRLEYRNGVFVRVDAEVRSAAMKAEAQRTLLEFCRTSVSLRRYYTVTPSGQYSLIANAKRSSDRAVRKHSFHALHEAQTALLERGALVIVTIKVNNRRKEVIRPNGMQIPEEQGEL